MQHSADYKSMFAEKENKNWIKSLVAVGLLKNGLVPFVSKVAKELHEQALSAISAEKTVPPKCSSCGLPDVLPCPIKGVCRRTDGQCEMHSAAKSGPLKCPSNVCNQLKEFITRHHRHSNPSWRNTDPTKWCSSPWQMAKCFFPPDGYENAVTPEDTDLNGIISFAMNCTLFDQYYDAPETCKQVRQVTKELRHAAQLRVTDLKLAEYFEICKTHLSDTKYLNNDPTAQLALQNIQQLEDDDLFITEKMASEVLHESTRKNLDYDMLKNIKELLDIMLNASADRAQKEYKRKLKDLEEDLIVFYQENHSTLAIGPLCKSKLEEVFIPPYIVKRSSEHTVQHRRDAMFHPSKYSKYKTPVISLDELLLVDGRPAKKVFISALAGYGKTAFCRFLVMCWCAKKSNDESQVGALQDKGHGSYLKKADAIKGIRLLFYISLRQVSNSLCDIDDMIYKQIIIHLSRMGQYDKTFLEHALHKERIVILLDGYDEWTHPSTTSSECIYNPCNFPHVKARPNCTIITTSRPWKLSLYRLQLAKQHLHLEIKEMDFQDRRALVQCANECLNRISCTEKDFSDFLREAELKNVTHLLSVPLIAVQLLCIWRDDGSITGSHCTIYCKILEILFDRTNCKPNDSASDATVLPSCFKKLRNCQRFKSVIDCLQKLAYDAFDENSGHAINEETVEKDMSEDVLVIALQTGIISRSEAGRVGEERYIYTFLHSTYQEFLCCMYLATHKSPETKQALTNLFKEDVLENMFFFWCGLDLELARFASQKLAEIKRDRAWKCPRIKYMDVRSHRDLILKGYEEAMQHLSETPDLVLGDIVIDSRMDLSHQLIPQTKQGIFSFVCILQKLEKKEIINMESVHEVIKNSNETLQYIFLDAKSGSNIQCDGDVFAHCLKLHTIEIRNMNVRGNFELLKSVHLSSITLQEVRIAGNACFSAENLHYCCIRAPLPSSDLCVTPVSVALTHGSKFTNNLKELALFQVKIDVELDLLACTDLRELILWDVYSVGILLKDQMLESLYVGGHLCDDGSGWTSVIQSLSCNSSSLRELYVNGIEMHSSQATLLTLIPTFTSLEVLQLMRFEIQSTSLELPKSILNLSINSVKMGCSCLKRLFNQLLGVAHSVDCKIEGCEITDDEENIEEVKEYIIASEKCTVTSIDIEVHNQRWIPRNIEYQPMNITPNVIIMRFKTKSVV